MGPGPLRTRGCQDSSKGGSGSKPVPVLRLRKFARFPSANSHVPQCAHRCRLKQDLFPSRTRARQHKHSSGKARLQKTREQPLREIGCSWGESGRPARRTRNTGKGRAPGACTRTHACAHTHTCARTRMDEKLRLRALPRVGVQTARQRASCAGSTEPRGAAEGELWFCSANFCALGTWTWTARRKLIARGMSRGAGGVQVLLLQTPEARPRAKSSKRQLPAPLPNATSSRSATATAFSATWRHTCTKTGSSRPQPPRGPVHHSRPQHCGPPLRPVEDRASR